MVRTNRPQLSHPTSYIYYLGSPDDFASPGYFSTNLSNSIRVELTSTRRTALHRYTFPTESNTPRILLDVTNDGQISGINPEMTIDPETGRMTGESTESCFLELSSHPSLQQVGTTQPPSDLTGITRTHALISKARDTISMVLSSMGPTKSITRTSGERISINTTTVRSLNLILSVLL